MEQHSFSVLEKDQPTHVNNGPVTGFLGVVLGIVVCVSFVNIAHMMGWNPVVAGILTGLSGAVMGAFGSTTPRPNFAAILGWAGATNFILGFLMFFGLVKGLLG